MNEPLGYEQLSDALRRAGIVQDAAEYHGALCGALCVRTPGEIDLLRLLGGAAPGSPADDARQALGSLCGQSAEALESVQMTFAPVLPDDAEALDRRVQALSAWCEGFLYGLTTGRPLNMKLCSPELKEILRDFTEFTRAGVDDGDSELEETAYAEVVEYIRVGVQLVYMELHGRPEAPGAAQRLH